MAPKGAEAGEKAGKAGNEMSRARKEKNQQQQQQYAHERPKQKAAQWRQLWHRERDREREGHTHRLFFLWLGLPWTLARGKTKGRSPAKRTANVKLTRNQFEKY